MKILRLLIFLTIPSVAFSQQTYLDSMEAYRRDYIEKHEVVTGDDRKLLDFYNINEKYRVLARMEKPTDNQWFQMPTSGSISKTFRVYGILHFTINDTSVSLPVYQSQNLMNMDQYRHHLFLPFTDISSGIETYETGRYIDLDISDIKDGKIVIDFNKAYNPYCAYVSGKYNCPIPPTANRLNVLIAAGEKAYLKK